MLFTNSQVRNASNYVYNNLKKHLDSIYYREELTYEKVLLRFDSEVKEYLYDIYKDNEEYHNTTFENFYDEMSERIIDFKDFDNIVYSLHKRSDYIN